MHNSPFWDWGGRRSFDRFALLSPEQIAAVVEAVRPEIEALLRNLLYVWGPSYLALVIALESAATTYQFTFGSSDNWDPSWGDPQQYMDTALAKIKVSRRTGYSSREVRDNYPFLLRQGDCLWAGAVTAPGIAVGGSGLTENGDEKAAQLVLDRLLDAGNREIERRRESDDSSQMILSQV